MKDRISQYPGRIKLIPVDKNNGIYDVVRADEPTQEGTPLNTANLFSSTTSQQILAHTLDFRKGGAANPDTVDLGIRRICEHYGAYELASKCNFHFIGDSTDITILDDKLEFLDTSIKYLAALDAVFVSIAFVVTDKTYSTTDIYIEVSSEDTEVADIIGKIYGVVPMISNIPEGTRRSRISSNGFTGIAVEVISATAMSEESTARNPVIVTGMYPCRAVFTVSGSLFGDSSPYTYVVGADTTWSEWIGTSRQFIFKGNRFVFRIYAGVVVSSDQAYAVSLDGSTAVRGSDLIQNGAKYSVINWSAGSLK